MDDVGPSAHRASGPEVLRELTFAMAEINGEMESVAPSVAYLTVSHTAILA
jgi:hypothetical protein